MRRAFVVAFVLITLMAVTARAAETDAVAKAEDAARSWLALVDAGKYAQSWDEAAGYFKGAVTKDGWVSALTAARAPLGALKSRTLRQATFTTTLPGAPDGQYVVIQYDTQFENKAAAVETVTPMLDKDGAWRVSGYFIR
jgi:hypothetical protein